jgi:hypothetical protein
VDLKHSKVAITGATGFLGGYLVDTLLARGAHVVAVVRNPDKAASLSRRGVEVRRADLADRQALELGFKDVDAVISNAAVVSFTNMRERPWPARASSAPSPSPPRPPTRPRCSSSTSARRCAPAPPSAGSTPTASPRPPPSGSPGSSASSTAWRSPRFAPAESPVRVTS